jgi:hypothetical protein
MLAELLSSTRTDPSGQVQVLGHLAVYPTVRHDKTSQPQLLSPQVNQNAHHPSGIQSTSTRRGSCHSQVRTFPQSRKSITQQSFWPMISGFKAFRNLIFEWWNKDIDALLACAYPGPDIYFFHDDRRCHLPPVRTQNLRRQMYPGAQNYSSPYECWPLE